MAEIKKECPNCPDPCKERHNLIWDLIYRVREAAGGGMKGLLHRYNEQVTGANGPGTEIYRTHRVQYHNQRRQLRSELRRYRNSYNDNGRGGKDPCPETELTQEAQAWVERDHPSEEAWEGPGGETPFPLKIVAGAGAIVLGVGAVIAAFIPFDGPLGEVALGSGAAALWTTATQ